jgi:nicotinate phosphoribosyltransferase
MPQGLPDCNPAESQKYAWDRWCREYKGDLGVCLTDTLGQNKFETDFTMYWANLFTGLRHDSGNPFEWGRRAIKLYEKHNIDPKTKLLMFSDSLDFKTAASIFKEFDGKVKLGFGIGTFLTNDMIEAPLNVVMKLVRVNNKPVAKLSNVPGKHMGDPQYVEWLKQEVDYR